MTEEAALKQASVLLYTEGSSTEDILKALVDSPTEQVAIPRAPKKVELTDEAHRALAVLPAVFGRVQPESARVLTEQEQEALGEEALVLEAILDSLVSRKEAIKEAVRNHLDKAAEEEGDVSADTPKDKNGHYVLGRPRNPWTLRIPGTNKQWSSSYRAGRVSLDGDELLRLYETNEITREQYLEFTREVRVLDENKIWKAVRKSPEKLGLVKKITKRGLPGSALTISKK